MVEVAHGRADISAQWFTVTSERLQHVDFAESFHNEHVVLVAKYQFVPLPILNAEVLASLSAQLWILITALTIFTGLIIYFGERIIALHSNFESGVHVLTYTIGLLFQRDIGGLIPNNLDNRVV